MVEPLSLVFISRHANSYSLNALAGAVESRFSPDQVGTSFAKNIEAARDVIQKNLQGNQRVVVAWSFCSMDEKRTRQDLAKLRNSLPSGNVLHLAGGPHASGEPRRTLSLGFDFVAIGEGENLIISFLSALLQGDILEGIPGLAFLKEGYYLCQGSGLAATLDSFPPFPLLHKRFHPLEITRGCPYACRYCQISFLFSPRFRHRSLETVRHWVGIMKQAGLRDIRFVSPSSLSYGSGDKEVNLDSIGQLLESVRSITGKSGRIFFGTFPSEVRPEHVTHQTLKILKAFVSNDNLLIGAQAGSDRMLQNCHRGHSVAQAIEAVRLAIEYGFKPQVDIIFGLPQESTEESAASLKMAEMLASWGARIHAHTFMPLPGTPWKSMPPGRLDTQSQRRLKQLTADGKVFGKWEGQIKNAQVLASLQSSKDKARNL